MNLKRLQRQILDSGRRKKNLSFIIIFLIVLLIWKKKIIILPKQEICHNQHFVGTAGDTNFDVVYTWVNGSDPEFISSIKKYNPSFDPARFDDKNELRYSLRSLEKYAPWVRHVYIVTNGQIPHWLDLSNSRVSVITHEKLFRKAENLPTFSSSAIETFIHRIPNLSKRFLYLNDDIFLNARLYPDDLYTNADGVKIYNAWTVPDCAYDCPWVYIGDGSCDQHCNIAKCQFDGGDCDANSFGIKTDDFDTNLNLITEPFYISQLKNSSKTMRSLKSLKRSFKDYYGISFQDFIKNTNVSNKSELKSFIENFNAKQKFKFKPKHVDIEMRNNPSGIESTRDIFSHSLIFTNMLLNQVYGFKARYVLAHVGFLLDKDIIEHMHSKFKFEVEKTAANRFRSDEDLQFAFLYYNFLMSEKKNLTIDEIFDEFDTDNSMTWSDREIRTFLTRVYPLPLDWAAVKYFEEVVNNCSSKNTIQNQKNHYSTLVYERYEDSNIPTVTKNLVGNCKILVEALRTNFGQKSMYKFTVNIKREVHSNFMMLKSNITEVIDSLDKLRRNPKKFNCINDNLEPQFQEENELIKHLLEDFYISFFPFRSQFELPDHYRNKFLYMNDFERWKNEKFLLLIITYFASAILLGFFMRLFCWHKAKCARRYIQML